MNEIRQGTLYICATPLGNLDDITLRALKVMRECDLIAAEDTRRTIKLLNYYNIKTPLTSYHEHNEKTKGAKLLEEINCGKNICLVSDAGMPGISDPGHIVIKMAVEKGINIVPLPGPTAAITALVASGLDTERFVFEGFLPKDKKSRKKVLDNLVMEERTSVLYEAPHRIKRTLKLLFDSLGGDRKVVLARELTKIHEEFIRGSLAEIVAKIDSLNLKGEFCIVIEGTTQTAEETRSSELDEAEIVEKVNQYIDTGLSKKDAIKEVARRVGLPKREVYNTFVNTK